MHVEAFCQIAIGHGAPRNSICPWNWTWDHRLHRVCYRIYDFKIESHLNINFSSYLWVGCWEWLLTISLLCWMKNCFLLKEILTILAHENWLILTPFWKMLRLAETTPMAISEPSVSWMVHKIEIKTIKEAL